MRRSLILALAVAGLAPGTASAGGWTAGGVNFTFGSGVYAYTDSPTAEVVAQHRSAVRVSGEMIVAYEPDPATCAAVGRCDIRGTTTWRPPRRQNLYLNDVVDRGKRSVSATVFPDDFTGAETVSQVRRTRASGGTALCSDARGASAGLDGVVVGRQLVFGVRPDGPGPLDTRCAGPLWHDLRFVLPRPRFDLSALRKSGGAADLRAEQTFTTGGLRGTVRSTLVASLTPPRKLRPDRVTQDDEDHQEPRLQRWRVSRVSGSVRIDVRGSSVAARCEPLDACGLVGSITFTPKPDLEQTELFTALLDEPDEDGSRFVGSGAWVDTGVASATFSRPDATAPCQDTVPLTGGFVFMLESKRRVAVAYDPFPGIRTRCAGPVVGSAFESATAAATLPLARFRGRRVTLRLTEGVTRTVEGYRVTSHPDLTIELVRRR